MGTVAVGQHHFIRSFLPGLIAVLLSAALALVAVGVLNERNLETLARDMAQRTSPAHQVAVDLDLAVGQLAVASLLTAQTGDARGLVEAQERLESAARAYDGWMKAARIGKGGDVTTAVHQFELRIAVASQIDPADTELALSDMSDLLRRNRRIVAEDSTRILDRIAACQHRRLWFETLVMLLLSSGCVALMVNARRREERICDDEKRAVRSLEETNADLEAFAGRVAHDLRNPLVPILAGSQVIEHSDVDARVKRAAERIQRSARRLAAMIDMLLDFSRLSTTSKRVVTNVGPIVEEVVDGFREKARAHGVTLVVSCEGKLRAAVEPIVVASPLQNLVENAFKYGRRPGIDPVIEVRSFWRAGTIMIEIEDRGPGIKPEQAETLFRAFARGNDSGGDGVGLGLATARRLVEARGGSIGLRVGRFGGALFQIRLPAAYAPRHEQREALSGAKN